MRYVRRAMAMRRKVVFVIVEGPSDKEALEVLLEHVLDADTVYVHVYHGDITSATGVNVQNINARICRIVKSYASMNGLRSSDFVKVVHLMDTGGAFVDDACISEDPDIGRAEYHDDRIVCHDRQGIIKRNQQKSAVMRKHGFHA